MKYILITYLAVCLIIFLYCFGANRFFSNVPSSMELYKRVKIKVLKTNSRDEEE